jgi:hypothetical protein
MGKIWTVPRTWITSTQATWMEGWPWVDNEICQPSMEGWRQGGQDGLLLYESIISVVYECGGVKLCE